MSYCIDRLPIINIYKPINDLVLLEFKHYSSMLLAISNRLSGWQSLRFSTQEYIESIVESKRHDTDLLVTTEDDKCSGIILRKTDDTPTEYRKDFTLTALTQGEFNAWLQILVQQHKEVTNG